MFVAPKPVPGAALITNLDAQPLAGMVVDAKDVGQDGVLEHRRSYELIFKGYGPTYVPLIRRNYNNVNTGVYVKNMSYLYMNAFAHYYGSGGAYCGPDSISLVPNGIGAFSPSPSDAACPPAGSSWLGSTVIDQSDIGVVTNQVESGTNRASAYAAISLPGRMAVVPLVLINTDYAGRSNWTTQIRAQNTNPNVSATAVIRYYTSTGQFAAQGQMTIAPRSSATFSTGFLNGFGGSAVIEANQPIAVVATYGLASSPDSDDYHMAMTAVHR